jgi:para-aminobenzoate synthetase component 1
MADKYRKTGVFTVANPDEFVLQALYWANRFDHCHSFTDNSLPYPYKGFRKMLAVGCHKTVPITPTQTFESVQAFYDLEQDWLIGYFSYDLKNEIEELSSHNTDVHHSPPAYFYVPLHLIHWEENAVRIESFGDPNQVFAQIEQTRPFSPAAVAPVTLHARTDRNTYLQQVEQIKEHILEGDVYELTYCMEFYAFQAKIDPVQTYLALNKKSPMPFSVFGKINQHYLLCASPERFLQKQHQKLISQPIKGTARRGTHELEDKQHIEKLRTDEKERAENMMIVDLVRNDLARSATTGSVKVEEIFGIYTFAHLHQMISTVSSTLRPGVPLTDAIKKAFPMGSMTGAPKIKAMELIEQYEDARRGLFSGAVGYITPNGDFDFNVVIRSIFYNAANEYLSFQVGSAITYDAEAESEYDECMLKAKAILDVLGDLS